MKTLSAALVVAGVIAAIGVLALAFVLGTEQRMTTISGPSSTEGSAVAVLSPTSPEGEAGGSDGFLYGRVETVDGASFEGRLRWGGDEEAFWSDYFNGSKATNPWALHVPPERLTERRPFEVFGIGLFERQRPIDLDRPFMVRFGDIVRLEAEARTIRVTLRSGTVVDLDRLGGDDLADGLRVWDATAGVVDLDEWRIRSVEHRSSPRLDAAPSRLRGTVRTPRGDFTGFVQWNRRARLGSDTLAGRDPDGDLTSLRFDTVRSITRESADSSRVAGRDGREIVLSGTRDVGPGHRGVTVDDQRFGRVLVSWDIFERLDLDADASGSGPAYDDFSPGRPLVGTLTTHAGDRLGGRLVFDLDESETTETLDAPSEGIDFTIPFGRVVSIVLAEEPAKSAEVSLRGGATLRLDRAGDLGDGNAGLLVIAERSARSDRARPEYVPWRDVRRIDFDVQ